MLVGLMVYVFRIDLIGLICLMWLMFDCLMRLFCCLDCLLWCFVLGGVYTFGLT